jgi:soluble lytic murein transglycosylase-like protein
MKKFVVFIVVCLAWSVSSQAEVKMIVREDGVPFIYNEDSDYRNRRLATEIRALPTEHRSLSPLIERHAAAQELDHRLVQAVIQVESGYNPQARSRKGAMGLMQLMPETARDMRVRDAYDPDENIRGGTAYLRRMLDRFGTLELALAAYNAGPTAVARHGGVPPYRETRNYVRRVLTLLEGVGVKPPVVRTRAADTAPEKPKVFIRRDSRNRILITTEPTDRR